MEDHRIVERLIQKGDFATSLDLSQAYFLIPIHKDFTPFLAFKFEERYYGFKGMPFGFKDAPRIFTKVMRKVSQEIRRRCKVRCISFLDDVLLLDPDQVKLKTATQEIVDWFQQLGLIINREKSKFFPKKNFNYLGWTWNTSRMVVSMEQQRRRELRKECIKWMKRVRKNSFAKIRDFASFIGGQERWLGRSGVLEQQHKKTIGLLDSKAQGELQQRTGGFLETRRHINDRCFPLGLRSNLGSWRREISFSQTVQQQHKNPNIQFQGAPCSFIGSQQLFITNHSQPCVWCGTQPPAFIEKDQGYMSVDEIDDDSNPHSRGEKHNRRRIVQVRGRRRLYDKESMSEGSGDGSRSDSRERRFRKRRKQEEGDMVWSRKSVRSRWSHRRLDKEHNAHSPSDSVDSSESQESKSRESESNHSSSIMEESDMEQLTGRDDVSILRLEEFESGFNPGSRPEENGCSTASRGIHGSNNQLVREVGEEWWWRSLRICGVPDRIISVTKESIAKSTWTTYTFGFAHFSREWEELKLGPFPKYFDEWSMDCANCLLSMRDKGGKYSCLKSYTKMWSPDIVLSYYENYGLNEYLSFFNLTVKCILLVMLFTSCRFHELEQISMANSIFENDAIYLSTRLKTSRSREYITVPCLEDVHKRICPARAIHTLWERVKATYENRDKFLLNTTHHTLLTAKGIRTLARLGLRKAGVPEEYRPYTIMHASISKLASSGIPEVCIAKHARLSTTAHTPSRSYYKANLANRMACVLLAPEEDSSQQDENTVVKKSRITKQIEGIPFCATQQTTTISEPFTTQAPSPNLPSLQSFPATQPNQTIILPMSVEEPEDNNTG
ncbi:putative Transposon Ty3-G Gag-Pol polyprotein [Monocercomonoides exilis]|uniref:putative Transposon Ty3-G Gag-Pol polyprotein n=1 Tax=Monocercomonoides exilis TaxID=2049356 RepID=UPI0035597374|nr:putative Transposon Ty3-G Gag-Pol polyprotein [Monocercomonoides exilis]|eukprot:MONOS_10905.1-p1 / transcript=MONOS_10905.1 / gene=MONOS_10905 / organism=Monocercomonoides_exilis_PA203 / gene_product=reverse transcriptase / transcript_product=reverse transcriptase / location=Mono_scaffold00517:7230-10040(+) / protein_length=838 / sequence_SO=supercontig / SO=protein_coding / is_pseudo=false